MRAFDALVGQEHAVRLLAEVARTGAGMTHAWLFTGPAGSGRSVAARAFAAALQCPDAGCGTCHTCRTVLAGTHPDVRSVSTDGLSLGVQLTREIVVTASSGSLGRRWQVIVVEDADRLTERAGNALLKAIEEPPPATVWLLCAPSAEDVLPTIRSRCRQVVLRAPDPAAVARALSDREGISPELAAFAARAAQGHIGRARRLATDEHARLRRDDVLRVATSLDTPAHCLEMAKALVDAARAEADAVTGDLEVEETASMRQALGDTGRGVPRGSAGALRDLEARQKSRRTRAERDALDRALGDLAALWRDVLVRQLGAPVDPVHVDRAAESTALAARGTPAATLRRLQAVMDCRTALDANANPQLALEAMLLTARAG